MIRFYSKSADVAPGTGSGGEYKSEIPITIDGCVAELPKDFRKTLSNFSYCSIEYDKHTFKCVEALYHYLKYRIHGCKQGCIDILSDPNRPPEYYKKLGRKHILIIDQKKMDRIQPTINLWRFRQDPEFRIIIRALLKANYTLDHYLPRQKVCVTFFRPADLEVLESLLLT